MKHSITLTVASLLSIVLTTLHLADDIARGIEGGGLETLAGVLILVVWLYGTLMPADRRSGQVIVLLGSLGGAAISVTHMTGAGLAGGRIAGSDGIFFWVWTLLALSVATTFSLILAARGLWTRQTADWISASRDRDLRRGSVHAGGGP